MYVCMGDYNSAQTKSTTYKKREASRKEGTDAKRKAKKTTETKNVGWAPGTHTRICVCLPIQSYTIGTHSRDTNYRLGC
jgi:hypothetical protein